MSDKKILHVVNVYFVIPYFLGNQLLYFKDRGYKEHIICSPSDEIEEYSKQKGFSYLEVSIKREISLISDFKAVLRTYRYIKKNKIDVVVGHTPKGALIAMIAAYLAKVPNKIYFRHGLVYETSKGIKRSILKNIDRLTSYLSNNIICVSPSVLKRSVEDKLSSISKQTILHLGTCNGIDIKHYDPLSLNSSILESLKNKYNIADEFVIGYVGRLVKDKGVIELVDAFTKFNKQFINSRLLLVGMLEKRDALPTKTILEIETNKNIVATGYINNCDIVNYYGLFDLFILPSYREGFPTVVLEASAMQLPVITTKATGCVDSIIDNVTGLFVNHSSMSIYNAVKYLYDNPIKCQEMGIKGREFVSANFQQSVIWNEIHKLYS